MANTTENDLIIDEVKHWTFRWWSCVTLGGLAFTFAFLALLSAFLASRPLPRSRSRHPRALSGRDSLALALLGGQTANMALGLIALWFGTENLPRFLYSHTCSNLVFVGVASQWNVALSTPVLTLYYTLILAFYPTVSRTANQQERNNTRVGHHDSEAAEPGEPIESREQLPQDDVENVEGSEGADERRGWEHHTLKWLICRSCWAGKLGVLTLVGVVNTITLAVTLASLSQFLAEGEKVVDIEGKTSQPFCIRFFGCSELFPRQTMGGVFLVSAVVTAAAILALSREVERESKRRHTVGAVDFGDQARLLSFTRPPDEGIHFHHYADPPQGFFGRAPARAFRDDADSQSEQITLAGGEQATLGLRLPRGTLSVNSFVTEQDSRHSANRQDRMALSDSEFYDRERTRLTVQSPPPLAAPARPVTTSDRLPPHIRDNAENGLPGLPRLNPPRYSRSLSASPSTRPGQPGWQNFSLSRNRLLTTNQMISFARNVSDTSSATESVDWTREQNTMQSTNQNADHEQLSGPADRSRSPQLPVSVSSGSTASDLAAVGGGGAAPGQAELDGMWANLRSLRLADLIFPHRQSEVNSKRFSHTRVKHVREELIPPSPSLSSTRDPAHHRLVAQPSVLSLAQFITCHTVRASGTLFVVTYVVLAFFLLFTPGGRFLGQDQVNFRFIDATFEPYFCLVLLKASLDSFFCFALLVSLPPERTLL